MNRKCSVLSAALMASAASGHICMWNPVQRGGEFEITIPGQHICYLKQGPCGEMPSEAPITSLTGGQDFNILFQQNLNHFYQENPGRLQADFAEVADPTEEDFYPLGEPIADWNGYNMITQTNFTINVQVPNIDCEHCVLRMRYISQNPTEDHGGSPTFHQCADVSVKKGAAVAASTSPSKKVSPTGGSECCAPKQFTLEGYETGSGWRNPTSIKYFFDAENELFRIDQNSGSGTTSKDGKFRMYNDFKNGIEYYYNVVTDVCDLYGLNIWADWCYGDVNKQVYSDTVRVGDDAVDVWKMEGNDFFFSNTQETCTPVSKYRSTSGETTVYYNMKGGAPPADFFDLPSACLEAAKGVDATKLSKSPSQHKHM